MTLLRRVLHRTYVPQDHLPGEGECIVAFINDMHSAEAHQLMYRIQRILKDVVDLRTKRWSVDTVLLRGGQSLGTKLLFIFRVQDGMPTACTCWDGIDTFIRTSSRLWRLLTAAVVSCIPLRSSNTFLDSSPMKSASGIVRTKSL